jgi:hypothetical protein
MTNSSIDVYNIILFTLLFFVYSSKDIYIGILLLWQLNISIVMPELIRHPVPFLIPASAGMTALTYIVAGVIIGGDPHLPYSVFDIPRSNV